jgi:hypothetical protein
VSCVASPVSTVGGHPPGRTGPSAPILAVPNAPVKQQAPTVDGVPSVTSGVSKRSLPAEGRIGKAGGNRSEPRRPPSQAGSTERRAMGSG